MFKLRSILLQIILKKGEYLQSLEQNKFIFKIFAIILYEFFINKWRENFSLLKTTNIRFFFFFERKQSNNKHYIILNWETSGVFFLANVDLKSHFDVNQMVCMSFFKINREKYFLNEFKYFGYLEITFYISIFKRWHKNLCILMFP